MVRPTAELAADVDGGRYYVAFLTALGGNPDLIHVVIDAYEADTQRIQKVLVQVTPDLPQDVRMLRLRHRAGPDQPGAWASRTASSSSGCPSRTPERTLDIEGLADRRRRRDLPDACRPQRSPAGAGAPDPGAAARAWASGLVTRRSASEV